MGAKLDVSAVSNKDEKPETTFARYSLSGFSGVSVIGSELPPLPSRTLIVAKTEPILNRSLIQPNHGDGRLVANMAAEPHLFRMRFELVARPYHDFKTLRSKKERNGTEWNGCVWISLCPKPMDADPSGL